MKKTDIGQALTIAGYGIRQELRTAFLRGNKRAAAKKRGKAGSALRILFYAVFRMIFASIFSLAFMRYHDDRTRALLICLSAFIWLLLYGIIEYADIIGENGDEAFFKARPVSGSAYLLSQMLVIGATAGIECLLFSAPSAAVTLIFTGNIQTALLTAAAVIPSGMSGLFTGIILYYIMAAIIPQKHMTVISTVVQALVQMGALAGMVLIRFLPGNRWFTVPENSALMFTPPGLLSTIAAPDMFSPYRILLFCTVFAALILFCVRVLDRNFMKDPVRSAGRPKKRPAKTGGISFGVSPESAAVRRLFFANLRHDAGFRSGIILVTVQTLVLFFLFFYVLDIKIADPFTASGRSGFPGTVSLYLAAAMNLLLLKDVFSQSRQHRAGWLFFTAPVKKGLLVREVRIMSLIFVFVPYLLFLSVIFILLTGSVIHSLIHFAAIGLVYLIFTGIIHYGFPAVPFSAPRIRGSRISVIMLFMAVSALLTFLLVVLVEFVYPSAALLAGTFLLMGAVSILIEIRGPSFAENRLLKAEFK